MIYQNDKGEQFKVMCVKSVRKTLETDKNFDPIEDNSEGSADYEFEIWKRTSENEYWKEIDNCFYVGEVENTLKANGVEL